MDWLQHLPPPADWRPIILSGVLFIAVGASLCVVDTVRHRSQSAWLSSRALDLIAALTATILVQYALISSEVLEDLTLWLFNLAGFLAYLLLHVSAGRTLVVPLLHGEPEDSSRYIIYSLISLGLVGVMYFSLLSLHVSLMAVFVIHALVIGSLALPSIRSSASSVLKPQRSCPQSLATWFCIAILVSQVALVVFFNDPRTTSPPTAPDAMSVHLASTKAYLIEQELVFLPHVRFSMITPLLQMQFLPLLGFFGEIGPKFLELWYLICVLVLSWSITRDLLSSDRKTWAIIVPCLLVTTPLIQQLAAVCYLGLPATALLLCAFKLTQMYFRVTESPFSTSWRVELLVGVSVALLFWVKVQVWIGIIGITLTISIRHIMDFKLSRLRHLPRALVVVGIVSLTVASPVMVRNAVLLGNPFFPAFGSIFGYEPSVMSAEDWEDVVEVNRRTGLEHTFFNFFIAPFAMVNDPGAFRSGRGYLLGPAWIPVFVAALAGMLLRRSWALSVFLAILYSFWFYSAQELRYSVHLLPFAAMGGTLLLGKTARPRQLIVILIVGGFTVSGGLVSPAVDMDRTTLNLSGYPKLRYLWSHVPGVRAARWLEDRTGPDSIVYSYRLSSARFWYRWPHRLVGDWFGEYRYKDVLTPGPQVRWATSGEMAERFREWGVEYFLLRLDGGIGTADQYFGSSPEHASPFHLLGQFNDVLVYSFQPTESPRGESRPTRTDERIHWADADEWNRQLWGGRDGEDLSTRSHAPDYTPSISDHSWEAVVPVAPCQEPCLRMWRFTTRSVPDAPTTMLSIRLSWLPSGGWSGRDRMGYPAAEVRGWTGALPTAPAELRLMTAIPAAARTAVIRISHAQAGPLTLISPAIQLGILEARSPLTTSPALPAISPAPGIR